MPRQAAALSDVRRNLSGFFRTRSGIARAGWQSLRLGGAVGLTALIVFHASLFFERLTDGQLLDPAVALRWVTALALTSGLVALQRRGVSLFSGRRALMVWLLVVLLHWSMKPITPTPDIAQGAASDIIFVLPSTAGVVLVGIGLLLATIAARRARPSLTRVCTVEAPSTGRVSSGWRPAGAARAPPLQTA